MHSLIRWSLVASLREAEGCLGTGLRVKGALLMRVKLIFFLLRSQLWSKEVSWKSQPGLVQITYFRNAGPDPWDLSESQN